MKNKTVELNGPKIGPSSKIERSATVSSSAPGVMSGILEPAAPIDLPEPAVAPTATAEVSLLSIVDTSPEARLRAFLQLRNELPTPALTADETRRVVEFEREIRVWAKTTAAYHPSLRNNEKRRLGAAAERAASPEEFTAAMTAYTNFDTSADATWRRAKGKVARILGAAAGEVLRAAIAREISAVEGYLSRVRALDLSDLDISTMPAVQRVEAMLYDLKNTEKHIVNAYNGEHHSSSVIHICGCLKLADIPEVAELKTKDAAAA